MQRVVEKTQCIHVLCLRGHVSGTWCEHTCLHTQRTSSLVSFVSLPRKQMYTQVHSDHHVFVNTKNEKFYCLPDNYEIQDASLDDIRKALNPRFESIELDKNNTLSKSITGVSYLPGYVGLNNLKSTDYVNATIHTLAHVSPLRNYFIKPENYVNVVNDPVVLCFGELVRKIWSSDNFKVNVAPHDFVNAIEVASEHRFRVGHRSTVTEFMPWLLSRLCRSIPLVRKLFSGKVKIRSENFVVKNSEESNAQNNASSSELSSETKIVPFIQLTLDLPDMPLFKDAEGTSLCSIMHSRK